MFLAPMQNIFCAYLLKPFYITTMCFYTSDIVLSSVRHIEEVGDCPVIEEFIQLTEKYIKTMVA